MISNAIPGIGTVNSYANTQSAKGIAVKQPDSDFQRTLSTAGAESKAAEFTRSFTKTVTNTVKSSTDLQSSADNVKAADATDNAAKTADTAKADTKKTDTTARTDDRSKTSDTAETAEVRDDAAAAQKEAATITEDLPQEETIAVTEDEDLAGALNDAAEELMEMLADTLDIDIEDIKAAMETLGVTNIAILDPVNMTQLIGELTGADDVMEIVTNADLYMNVQDMQDAVQTARQDLMQEFDLSEEELSSALEDFADSLTQPGSGEEKEPDIFAESAAVFDYEGSEELTGESRVNIEVNDLAAEVSEEISEDIPEELTQVSKTDDEKDAGKEDNSKGDGSMFNNMMNQISSSLSEVSEAEDAQQMSRANTQQIMDQITEFVRINLKAETTSLEMQLHPASLGTVNVMIEQAKDGNMIAKFVTQNEDVRAAIESQLQQLIEKFDEQGVKITAVEVTVNAKGFDQNLNDSQSQKDADRDAEESIRKPMRRIRLGDLMAEGDIPEIDEEDALTAEMMAINGNSVDFSA